MTRVACPRCRLAGDPHDSDGDCIAALAAVLEAVRRDVDELKSDLDARRAQDARARELHAEAEADLSRGG
jgi:hypothetical protein